MQHNTQVQIQYLSGTEQILAIFGESKDLLSCLSSHKCQSVKTSVVERIYERVVFY